MGRALFRMLAGGLGGVLATALMEPSAPKNFIDPAWESWQLWYSFVLGGSIGSFLGLATGWSQGTRLHALDGFFTGLLIGGFGGYVGMAIGGSLSHALFGNVLGNVVWDATDIPARVIAFAPMGAVIGLVPGAASRSWPRAFQGMVGGLIGAGIGGLTFDIVGRVFGDAIATLKGGDEVGIVGRALTAVMIGAMIGLLTALIENLAKSAWIRQVFGRNEYKEWIIDAQRSILGRSERAHVPLFGDPNVMPAHATIARQGASYTLFDGGSPIGTYLNGHRIGQAPLNPGDMIQIGPFHLQFLMKSGRGQPVAGPEHIGAYGGTPQPAPHGVPAPQQVPQAGIAAAVPGQQTQSFGSVAVPAIVATNGPLAGQRFQITSQIDIGREALGIAVGFDSMASRKHAMIIPGQQGLLIQDLGSTNGTLVNGQKVTSETLKPGDTVQIGITVFRVE